ncbi:MAG: RNA polymerase sigma-70 factor [Tannerellaceae bacterium]|jgi:RNA polymerase sigma-70 factor (ECF subfamily)|nr:RNA polymerase sigma-70 factor [Tannerellaceae bacterium]
MKKHPENTLTKAILHLLIQGDVNAFEMVYKEYSAWVYNFIYSLLHDKLSAEDFTQTVFLKLWECRAFIDTEKHLESYLFTIARHLVYKETESRLMKEFYLKEFPFDNKDDRTEAEIDAGSLHEYIDSLVEQLPPVRRRIYKLSRIEHLSNKEIASCLSISVKTVETQLYRALCFLKKRLSENNTFLLFIMSCDVLNNI